VSNGVAASDRRERPSSSDKAPQQSHSSNEGSRRSTQSRPRSTPAAEAAPRTAARGSAIAARVFGVMGMSVGTHMALLGMLGFVPAPSFEEPLLAEMEIVEPEPPPAAQEPEPAPEPEPEPEPEPPKPVPKIAAPKPAAPPPPQAEPKPAAEAPVDLTGLTLTGDDGASWSSVVGNGEQMQGPAARIGKVTGNDRAGASDGVVGGKGTAPALVGEESLSRRPVPPPGLDALLEQNFPSRARAQGVAGTAVVKLRIMADGRVGPMTIVRETGDYGFGKACMKVLGQTRWQAPLDKRGQPVATEIRFTCDFEVSY
jgi:TonB family protein